MDYYVLTLFPEMIESGIGTSITGRAMEKGIINLYAINIRDYATNKHKHVDDYPYGGGAGMVMQAEPICLACEDVENMILDKHNSSNDIYDSDETDDKDTVTETDSQQKKKTRVIYLTPQGKTFDQQMAKELAGEEELVLLCGHYEGIDERAIEMKVTDCISIGDYVLTGGELAAMVVMDAVSRMVPGVLSNEESGSDESFENNLLEYPQYTRPEVFRGESVPDILLSGHHANVDKWRRKQSLLRTAKYRPDLLDKADLTKEDKKILKENGVDIY